MGAAVEARSGGGRRRSRFRQRADINVTPLVDVMLVLLIIFMVTAPLLTVGVEVQLPRTQAQNLSADQEPLTVTIQSDGTIFVQETETLLEELTGRLTAVAQTGYEERIFIRADTATDYGVVAAVLAQMQAAGFTNFALVNDPTTQGASTGDQSE
jgi:biopolymer transport protein TolR